MTERLTDKEEGREKNGMPKREGKGLKGGKKESFL